jgi:hypothetical protein
MGVTRACETQSFISFQKFECERSSQRAIDTVDVYMMQVNTVN